MSEDKDTSLATTDQLSLVIPMMPIEELTKLTNYCAQVKKALMIEGKDYIVDGKRQYTARSGFAKLHQGFFLSDGKAEVKPIYYDEPHEFEYTHYIYKKPQHEKITTKIYGFEAYVTVINVDTGRHASGEGACTVEELHQTHNMSPKWYHRCLGTAKTRAWNRAVSNYVGSAEVSAEEMGLVYTDDEPPPRKKVDADVKVVDFVKPTELRIPEWLLADELNRAEDSWEQAKEMTESWMKAAGFNLADFEVKSDNMKITVKPVKAIPAEAMPDVEGIMLAASFIRRKNVWRLNRKDVVG